MKTDAFAFSASRRALVCSTLFCISAFVTTVLGDPQAILVLRSAPLSLPRLAPEDAKLGNKPLRNEAYEVLTLVPGQQTSSKQRGGAAYLEIEPKVEWQQKLRNQRDSVNYVSFSLYASLGTQIDVGGASLVIEQSDRDPSYAAIQAADPQDKIIHHEMPWMLFGGARMAPLYIVTVMLDRKAGTWAMWFRDMLVAVDMPLSPKLDAAQIRITAGKAGAWFCGLVCSDENPLFEDANDNGVPDDFEQKLLGAVLSKSASEQTQANLRLAWDEARKSRPPSEFFLTTPLPDSFPNDCSPEGTIVHSMTGGLKFGAPIKK